ncbi:protein of unknown function [Methylocaldum szegediense]|uniref:Uncharacterized protein n=1 Tax=Methylocaldum szegediense TaxID=73780 RepID=A0ABN8X2C8_9GAMM|nr:protein of unknown function [Methylocaldum szegediense]
MKRDLVKKGLRHYLGHVARQGRLERFHFVYTVDLRCGNHLAVVEVGCGERSEPHRTVRGWLPVWSPVSPA